MEKYEGYDSSWDWCKDHSRYHFDNNRVDQPGEWFSYLGQFQGDWSAELSHIINTPLNSITWATRKYSPYYDHADGTQEQSKMLAQEEYDLVVTGAGADLKLTDVVEKTNFGPTLTQMSEYFGLENAWCRLHVQQPGQMFNLHIDKLYDHCPSDPDRVCRILIFLADWEMGQFFCHGTHNLTQWKAGTAITFDWANVPHASANASRHMRPLMILTGVKSATTDKLLTQASATTIYQL